jgi:hypothetical protein
LPPEFAAASPIPLEAPDPEVPPEMDVLIRACLAKDRDERHLSARDIGDRLHEIAESIGSRSSARANALRVKTAIAWRTAATLVAAAAVVAAAIETRRLFPGAVEKRPIAAAISGVATTGPSSAGLRPVAAVVRPCPAWTVIWRTSQPGRSKRIASTPKA